MTMADWSDYMALMASPRAEYLGGPHNKQQAWSMFCHDAGQWPLMGHGALMVDDKQTGRCIGQVGINAGPLYPEHELGWFVYPDGEGHGYAFEAAEALREWAFATLKLATLVSYIALENTRSIKLARRLGAIPDDHAKRPAPDDVVFRHPTP